MEQKECQGIKVGETYTNKDKARTVTKIVGYNIYYLTEKNQEKSCWINTFQDWVTKGKKNNIKTTCKYEVAYYEGDYDFITEKEFENVEDAKALAKTYKENPKYSNVKVVEIKTTIKEIEI